ncbi:MAG: hypothetical protein DSO04_02860 [Hadesarchaea archaeon]|nr:MAG: hypothetical protein DSO04_02860 [Hadesarchaea archaeon]
MSLPPPESFPIQTADWVWENCLRPVFGTDWDGLLALVDEWYRLPTDDVVRAFLDADGTDRLPWQSVVSDCDDFAQALHGTLECTCWGYGFCFGQIYWWSNLNQAGHAQNLYVNDRGEVRIVEPQTDGVMSWSDILSRYPDAKPFLILL